MIRPVMKRLLNATRRVLKKCWAPVPPLLFQHGILGAVVIFTELITDGEWLEEHDMYCIRRLDLEELSSDHQDWARCEHNFYSTALQDKPSSQRFHPWLYNKLRMSVHVYATMGILLLGRAVWLIFQNEKVVAALEEFEGRVPTWDKETRWRKRGAIATLLRNNSSLEMYAVQVALAFYFSVVDMILLARVLLTFDPWAIKQHLGDRDILDPDDLAVTSFPPLTWCDVSQETGRLEGTYSYNCEVAANNTYVLLVEFLALSLAFMLIKSLAALFHCLLVAPVSAWRRSVLGTPVALPTCRAVDACQLGRYTSFRVYRLALRDEVRKRLGKEALKKELCPIFPRH